jgi:hypothetical protein
VPSEEATKDVGAPTELATQQIGPLSERSGRRREELQHLYDEGGPGEPVVGDASPHFHHVRPVRIHSFV